MAALVAMAIWSGKLRSLPGQSPNHPSPQPMGMAGTQLELKEKRIEETTWAKELRAQACWRTIEKLWDAVNASSNKLRLLSEFPLGEIKVAQYEAPRDLPHGIKLRVPATTKPSSLNPRQWRDWVQQFERDRWMLEAIEFRHIGFQTAEASVRVGEAAHSLVQFSAHLTQGLTAGRAMLEGNLALDWGIPTHQQDACPIKQIDASQLVLKSRLGEPFFHLLLDEPMHPFEKSSYADPLILYDLDHDGLSEIILAASNLVYRRVGDQYRPGNLCKFPPGLITSAVVADFDGDGAADLLCAKAEGLCLYRGSANGEFNQPGRLVWPASPRLVNTMAMTCGDMDQDGDLDLFLCQYRVPTLGQILRPFYYNANDGLPAHLLINDGQGNFQDATQSAGLSAKRWRRSYSSSFVDLDADGHLDLVVVSDFAGLDIYRNDGKGHFTDVTKAWIPESHAFGMAHALADFNMDGRLDLLMIGMPSPTADRLEAFGLHRPDTLEDPAMRSRMTYGNRLYLARPEGGFAQTTLSDTIARSGWSWGCSVFDFNNDGFPDVYIANGLESKQTVRDYEPEFWLHDIYVDASVDDLEATAYFLGKFSRTRGQGWSYGGYEKNRLFLNRSGKSFTDIGHLAGVALQQDSRNVASDDLDGDGRVDLLTATLEVWPEVRQTLRIYQNKIADAGHWIGLRFREEGSGCSPVGICVTLNWEGHSTVRRIVTGDSHRTQHSNSIHFGLGSARQVDSIKIQWINGKAIVLQNPVIDRWHSIRAPKTKDP